jgi:hypothetical protein
MCKSAVSSSRAYSSSVIKCRRKCEPDVCNQTKLSCIHCNQAYIFNDESESFQSSIAKVPKKVCSGSQQSDTKSNPNMNRIRFPLATRESDIKKHPSRIKVHHRNANFETMSNKNHILGSCLLSCPARICKNTAIFLIHQTIYPK